MIGGERGEEGEGKDRGRIIRGRIIREGEGSKPPTVHLLDNRASFKTVISTSWLKQETIGTAGILRWTGADGSVPNEA